ncbi:MAG: putative sulfatase [Planctomycetota bacterium]|jgi:arylsulfatase A-like enzyme
MKDSTRWSGGAFLAAALFALTSVLLAPSARAVDTPLPKEKDNQPNIVFVLCDDLGFGDIGVLFQNQREESRRFQTPNIDRLAGEGTLLTRHYCPAPVCAPSRASLLLGKHQGHAAIRNNQFDKALPKDHNLASVLKAAGYRTALIGKWGLQGKGKSPETWPAYPTKVGFDDFFGYVRHRDGHSHYPAHTTKARSPMELYDGDAEVSATLTGCYTADLFTARAKKLLVDHRKAEPETPLFLLLAYDTPHAALHVPAAAYPEGRGVEGGLQWLGEPGRMISTAQEPIDSWLHPDYRDQEWTNSEKRFATMVRRLDTCVGDLVATLDELGMGENTLFVLTSDNGPHKEAYTPGRRYDANSFDSFGPLDGIKRDVYEGGIRVPTLVRWPGTAAAGVRSDAPSQFHDWMPTMAEAAGAICPAAADGRSLVKSLKDPLGARESTVYVEYSAGGKTPAYEEFQEARRGEKRGEMQAIYLDGYMGVRTGIKSHLDPFQIYDTRADPGQSRDLADSSDEFRALGQRMRDQVLRMRRPEGSAKRPYDDEPIPALAAMTTTTGRMFVAPTGSAITRKGWATRIGYLDVPVTGAWTLSTQWARGCALRLHSATVIDDDFLPTGAPVSGTVLLEAGLHPFHLLYRRSEDGSEPSLSWEGPDQPSETIPEERFRVPTALPAEGEEDGTEDQ